jgi:hypothetical protein
MALVTDLRVGFGQETGMVRPMRAVAEKALPRLRRGVSEGHVLQKVIVAIKAEVRIGLSE